MLTTRILKITGVLIALFIVSFGLHYAILQRVETQLPFSLFNVYGFHAIFSGVICVAVIVVSQTSSKYRDQLGFLYLFTMVFKVVFFSMVFHDMLFSEIVLNKIENFSLLLPIFIFLGFEVVIISKILNNIQVK